MTKNLNSADRTPDSVTDARSVWVSSVIPGLTVQVIDPMPPTADDQATPPGAEQEPACESVGYAAPRSLNRLKPRTDARSKYRRSRLLRLRQQAADVKPSADDRSSDSSASPRRPLAAPTASTEQARPADDDGNTAAASAVTSVQRAVTDLFPASSPGEVSFPQQTEAVSSPPSSDDVVSVLRSELAGHIRPGEPAEIRPDTAAEPADAVTQARQSGGTSTRRRQASSRRESASRSVSHSQTAPSEEKYADWFRRVVLRNRWMSVFTTFYIHWLILLMLGMMVVHGPENAAALILNGTFTDALPQESESFDITLPEPAPEIDNQQSDATQLQTPDSAAADLRDASVTTERVPELDDGVMQTLLAGLPSDSTNDGNLTTAISAGDSAAPPNPAPPRAVREGSFSVWTEPAAPQAGEPYRIIIQIRLPDGLDRYSVQDLQGVVIGSDGYRKPIPGHLTGLLPVEAGYARLVVPIVSADEHVRDTVLIRSRRLKESQKLLIAFEAGR